MDQANLKTMNPAHRQEGAVLVMGLIFLVLLTLLGVSALGISSMEERMSGNTRDRGLAFQAAEAALRDCELQLQGASTPVFNGTNGMYSSTGAGAKRWEIDNNANGIPDVFDSNAGSRAYSGTVSGVAQQPRCIIEELPPIQGGAAGGSVAAGKPLPDTGVYLVTARGVGATATAAALLQSTYKR